MKKILFNNWALKIASLLLAFVLWFLIVQIDDPKDTKTLVNIPVKLINTELLDKQNKVYEVLDNTDTVRVTVRAPRSVIDRLRSTDIVAEADVSKLTDINTIAIKYDVQNVDGVDSIEGNHDFVQLNVEDRKNRWIKVDCSTSGEVTEGYMVSNVVLDQTSIEVSGPKSVVERIDHASVVMDVSSATTDLSANVEIELYDTEGVLMEWGSNMTANASHVHVSVEVLAMKTVPVEVNYTGVPKEGYMITGDISCEPGHVTIAGRSAVLDGISKITVPENKVSVEDAVEDVVETINIKEYLPENTRLADSSYSGRVTAKVSIEPIVEKTLELLPGNVTIVNAPVDVQIELEAPGTAYTVDVAGLNAMIEPLRSNMLRGVVDIAAWMEEQQIETLKSGVYVIPVTLELDEQITQKNEITVRITVIMDDEE